MTNTSSFVYFSSGQHSDFPFISTVLRGWMDCFMSPLLSQKILSRSVYLGSPQADPIAVLLHREWEGDMAGPHTGHSRSHWVGAKGELNPVWEHVAERFLHSGALWRGTLPRETLGDSYSYGKQRGWWGGALRSISCTQAEGGTVTVIVIFL